MNHRPVSRRALLCAAASLSLAPPARACEFFALTLRVWHPWARATSEGDSTAIVSMKFDEVTRSDRLIAVETPVAEAAELGGLQPSPQVDFAIPQGRETQLTESGTFLRLTGLKHPLGVGRSYPLRLQFAEGGEVLAQLNIDFPSFRFR